MRIKNVDDINKLGPHAKRQIEAALKAHGMLHAAPHNTDVSKNKSAPMTNPTPVGSSPVDGSTKRKPAKVMKNLEGLHYCPYPSPDPSVALHIALLREFGSWWEGGELVDEMVIPGHRIKFRYDFCLPRYRLAIEIDGFGYHRDLNSFKKDREKQKHALKNGWVVHRLTNSDLRNGLDEIIPDIKVILCHRKKLHADIIPVGRTWCSIQSEA